MKCLEAVFLKVGSKNPKGSLRRVFGGLKHSRGLNLLLVESTLIRQRQSLADCFSKARTSVCVRVYDKKKIKIQANPDIQIPTHE